MSGMRVGVMGGSGFARRTMVPALLRSGAGTLVAMASRSEATAAEWAEEFGCDGLEGYGKLLERTDIDVLYIPLPTGLHKEWCGRALAAGKHVLVEKSFVPSLAVAQILVDLARVNHLLVMENFHFSLHSQWARLSSFMESDEIGKVHLIRSTFGFPPFPLDNIRWKPELGGGALLDAGAYVAKVSQLLLGQGLEVTGASLQMDAATGVDRYGEAMFRNGRGQVAQVAFGFDYFYQCRLELLGTTGKMTSDRVFTAKPDYEPSLQLESPDGIRVERLPADDAYVHMWQRFAHILNSGEYRMEEEALLDQARLLEEIRRIAKKKDRL